MVETPQSDTDKDRRLGVAGLAQKWIAHILGARSAKPEQAFGEPDVASPGMPAATLVTLADNADALVRREVHDGCTLEVDREIDDVRKAILDDTMTYSRTDAEIHALERVWVSLLRLGLFDELLYLVRRHNLPLRPEVRTFLDYCDREYYACRRRGEAYRARHPDVDIFAMGCIVWGEEYVGNFLKYNLRSMLAPGNLPALSAQGRVVCTIVTDAAGERRMRHDPVFRELQKVADVEFMTIPDAVIGILARGHHVQHFYILYGMLDHCSIYFAEGAGAHLFMIPVDSIVADGSLSNMANYRHEGYECCGGGNIVAETETFLPALDGRFGDVGPIRISTDELATLAVEHAHHYFRSQVIASENVDFGKHPRELFWPVDGGVEIHSVFIHPLFTSVTGLARYRRKHFANIDYGMIPRMFSDPGAIKIADPRKAYVNNFTASGRRYETTGRAFTVEDFLRCHDYTYPVQKGLFDRAQNLPCRMTGWTMYADVNQDVRAISARFGVAVEPSRSAGAPQGVES